MARAKRKKSPNADLVKAVQDRTEDILDFYEEVENDRPVIVLDFQKHTICAYHYEEHKATLSVESQAAPPSTCRCFTVIHRIWRT
jgi:hypothetical protein